MRYAFQAEDLVKRFGSTVALDGVSLAAAPGTVLAVLGPNGAGKTTAIRILATLLRPDSGTATVGGYDVVRQQREVRRLIGLTGQSTSIDEDLTGKENLVLMGQLLDLPRAAARARAAELLDQFGLGDVGGRTAATYSGGMRRRLDLAASLVGRPSVIYLDEPTSGVDPAMREQVWRLVRSLVDDGSTVLLTTQYLEEADALANEISVIDHGKVIAQGSPRDLKRRVGGQAIVVRPTDPGTLNDVTTILAAAAHRAPSSAGTGEVAVPVDGDVVFKDVVRRLDAANIDIAEFALRLPTLDEVFVTLTGHRGNGERDRSQA
jgi:oleandomycin transport system ATP-binding protein